MVRRIEESGLARDVALKLLAREGILQSSLLTIVIHGRQLKLFYRMSALYCHEPEREQQPG